MEDMLDHGAADCAGMHFFVSDGSQYLHVMQSLICSESNLFSVMIIIEGSFCVKLNLSP